MTMTPPSLHRAVALDPHFYVDEAAYAHDISSIIPGGWQIVAPAALVRDPGDTIARHLGNVPVFIVRTETGGLNGFYNICPHRAGPIATCDERARKRLRCAYHGWTYDLDGRLRVAPEMQEAEDFDREQIRLTPIEVAEWSGMVWSRAGDGPPLSDVLAGVDDIVANSDLGNLTHHHRRLYDVAANWKVYADNYLEGYHLPFVHPGLTQMVEYPEYRTELGEWWSLQRSPVPDGSGPYAEGEGLYFFIYPNTMLNIMKGRVQTNRIIATGIDSCQVEFDFYYAPGYETRAEEDDRFSDQVQEEDRAICEHVQKGLTSGVYEPGRLSPTQEAGVWHWHNLLRRTYEEAGLGRPGV